jgi:hypothetical protein
MLCMLGDTDHPCIKRSGWPAGPTPEHPQWLALILSSAQVFAETYRREAAKHIWLATGTEGSPMGSWWVGTQLERTA